VCPSDLVERLYLDAPSLVYRAFFSWPKTLTAPSGQAVNAVRGYCEMVTYLLVKRRPAEAIAVFDADWRPAFRVAAYPGYKADRPDDPPELPAQFDILAEVLDAAGMTRAESPDLEADDAIATLVERVPAGERAVVVTGDRDLLALVRDPDVGLLFTIKGTRVLAEFDEKAVQREYGIPPRLYGDFATLRGDPSDGLPGVAGIGPKRASALLAQYGSIDGILDHLDALPARQAEAFALSQDYLNTMKTVVGLVRDAPVDKTSPHAPDEARLHALSAEYNLGSSPMRLAQALGGRR
jgi:5'-3' exonuclease